MKLKVIDTPENIGLLAEALRQSPLIATVIVSNAKKWADHTRNATAWLDVTFDEANVTAESKTLIVPPVSIFTPRRKRGDGQPRERAGYVYLIHLDDGYYKIGRTANPISRIRTFGSKLPSAMIKYAHLIETDDMLALESKLHRLFERQRSIDTREFFRLSDKDVAWFVALPTKLKIADANWSEIKTNA